MTEEMKRRLRVSGILLVCGLTIEFISFFRVGPLSFLGFLMVGGTLIIGGILYYLYSLVSPVNKE